MDPNNRNGPTTRTVAIIPVKSLAICKQRLVDQFEPAQRAGLMLAMLADVIAVLHEAQWPEEVWVVSADCMVLDYAKLRGAVGIRERSSGLNEAVSEALLLASNSGIQAALVVHGDLPAITAAEVLSIRTELADATVGTVGVVLCKNGGTTALYLSPVDAMPPQFGANSGQAHLEYARAAGIPARPIQLPGFSRDMDVAADIESFMQRNHPGSTGRFLASWWPQRSQSKVSAIAYGRCST